MQRRRRDMSPSDRAQGLPGAAPDFDHPLEMLSACHDRIEDRCELLHRLLRHMASHGRDEQVRQAAESVLRYFDTAGEHHHDDEERDLFPALVAQDAGATAALVAALRADHVEMRAAWQRLRTPLTRIARGASLDDDAASEAESVLDAGDVERFTALYRAHIAREEEDLLPLARRVLGGAALQTVGAAMARRRGLP